MEMPVRERECGPPLAIVGSGTAAGRQEGPRDPTPTLPLSGRLAGFHKSYKLQRAPLEWVDKDYIYLRAPVTLLKIATFILARTILNDAFFIFLLRRQTIRT